MRKNINWKNLTITILSVALLGLLIQNKSITEDKDILQNELMEAKESSNLWYSEYKSVLNELYFLEVETGRYVEDVQ